MQHKLSEVLMIAKDLILDGWVPREPREGEKEECAVSAICHAYEQLIPEIQDAGIVISDAEQLLADTVGVHFGDLTRWSDAGPKEEIVNGFDEAIRVSKEREQECVTN